jgi:hypothetical protein
MMPRALAHRPSQRAWICFAGAIVVLAAIAAVFLWPVIARRIVIAHVEAMTQRPARIDAVEMNPFTGRLAVRGFRLSERDGRTLFTDFDRLEVRVRPLALLRGHLWIREAVLEGSTVRVVRDAHGFNLSDLIEGSGPGGRALDVTVDHLMITKGLVTLEDRALAPPRTWRSEHVEIDARNLSTRRDDGTAVARSVTAGAAVSLEIQRMRLYPIHFEAVVTTSGLDLALARLYFPPHSRIVLERGRASSTLNVMLDARDGLRADASGELEDVVLAQPGEREPAALVPKLSVQLTDFLYRDDQVQVGRFELAGSASIKDPMAAGGGRFKVSTLRASIADVTWPVIRPGRLDVESSVPGGGALHLTGNLRPPPAASQLRLQLARVHLAPWTRLAPVSAGLDGLAEADLRIDEPLAPGVPTHVRGAIAVNQLGVTDAHQEVVGARRVEGKGIEVHWPSRLKIERLVLSAPRAIIERDRSGEFPLQRLLSRAAPSSSGRSPSTADAGERAGPSAPSLGVAVGEIVVEDGAIAWRDEVPTPRVALDVAGVEARVTGAEWPVTGPLGVRAAVRPPGGGRIELTGRLGVDPIAADVRVVAKGAEIAPYDAYVPVLARIGGRTDLDLAVLLPPLSEGRVKARGSAAVSRVDVRDGERTVMRVERAAATGLDVDWPRRVGVRELSLERPWILVERDRAGAPPLRVLLSTRAASPGVRSASETPARPPGGSASAEGTAGRAVPVTVDHLVIEDGGARVVDQHVSPPFALDFQRLSGRVEGLSTDPAAKPARLEIGGRVAATSILALRGSVGSLGGRWRVDLDGDLRGFAIPRANPYLLQQVAWEARDGWLTTAIHCRLDGDALDAKTDIRLSRLQLVRSSAQDEAQARIGLPLGLIVALMKDSRGDISVSLPVGGRLSDPRFDFREAIWSTIRNVAVKAIAAPVSWIGRLHVGSDSRIERVDVDPIPFPPGKATLLPDAREQVARVAAFLEQVPAVRLALKPVISPRDRAAFGQRALDGSTPAALAGNERALAPEVADLAARRLAAVRDEIKKAGVDPGRLSDVTPEHASSTDEGQVALDLVEPENSPPPSRPTLFRRLLGEAAGGAATTKN